MTKDANAATQEKLGGILEARDWSRMHEAWHEDVVDHDPAPVRRPDSPASSTSGPSSPRRSPTSRSRPTRWSSPTTSSPRSSPSTARTPVRSRDTSRPGGRSPSAASRCPSSSTGRSPSAGGPPTSRASRSSCSSARRTCSSSARADPAAAPDAPGTLGASGTSRVRPRRKAPVRLRALLATVVVGALAPVLLVAGPASAHDVLVSSDPAADATVAGDLDRITLTLSEPPLSGLQTGIVISVTDAQDAEHTSGDVTVEGNTIGKDLDVSETGSYLVRWRSVSVDGHPISGEYRFASSGPAALDSLDLRRRGDTGPDRCSVLHSADRDRDGGRRVRDLRRGVGDPGGRPGRSPTPHDPAADRRARRRRVRRRRRRPRAAGSSERRPR